MAAGEQTRGWDGMSRRRVPRFHMRAPLDLTVLRSGVPDTVPGRSVNVCERGVAAMVAGELVTGESVGIELQLPLITEPLRTRATVRYQDRLRCGLEFVALSAEQRAAIRDWAKEAKPTVEGTSVTAPVNTMEKKASAGEKGLESSGVGQPVNRPKTKFPRMRWLVPAVLVVSAVVAIWWRWNRGWEELESGLKGSEVTSSEKPRAQVPAEVMQKLLAHRVEPVYPAEARKERLEGTIALDIVVGRDGSVLSMHALNGPDILARAAMDALRWWKFEPYRVNGE